MSTIAPSDRVQLRRLPLFRAASEEALAQLAPHLYDCRYARGETILREGQYCDGAYYLIEGLVDVRLHAGAEAADAGRVPAVARPHDRQGASRGSAPPAPQAETVVLEELPLDLRPGDRAMLGPGEIFGEGSALSRYPIATDIVAAAEVRCLLIRTPALRAMFDQPEFASFKEAFDQRYRERTLRNHLRRVPLFRDVGDEALDQVAREAELVSFKPGRVIVEQGAIPEAFVLVRGGYVKVGVRVGVRDVAVTYLRKGDFAGETGLLLDELWPFTLTALEHVELVKIGYDRMRAILPARPAVERQLWEAMVGRLKRRAGVAANPLRSQHLQFAMDSGLIHGESVLLIDLERCTRCDDCVRACADAHDGLPRFVREGTRFRRFSVPSACYQCTDPVCMIGCPTGAISRPLGTLEVAIDQRTCIGCGNCVRRCPWDNIRTVPYTTSAGAPINLATKCDLCVGRSAGPACVQMCPHGAATRVNFKDHERLQALFTA
ncbi:MAG: cyclic nucleotide-binding domain-containing protein [Acidobacteria bacterium]|nr:cyclic nucleotide-binding domain-containing protein [Acidobacteriota bacterium]